MCIVKPSEGSIVTKSGIERSAARRHGARIQFWRTMRAAVCLIAKILELQSNRKILCPHGRDDSLQFIATLGSHSYFAALNLSSDFEFPFADETSDLFRDGLLQTLFDLDELPRVTEWRDVR